MNPVIENADFGIIFTTCNAVQSGGNLLIGCNAYNLPGNESEWPGKRQQINSRNNFFIGINFNFSQNSIR
jgi:hypothetical protein